MDEQTVKKLNKHLKEDYIGIIANLVNYDEIEILNIISRNIEMRISYDIEDEDFCLKYLDTSGHGMIFSFIEDIMNCLKEIENE